jgi:hypothetical protein
MEMFEAMSFRGAGLALSLVLLSACQPLTPPAAPPPPAAPHEAENATWRTVARDEDIDRVNRVDAAWSEGLAAARASGFGRALSAEGPLLAPGAALPRAALPPGSYRCRLMRLGGGRASRAFTAFQPFFCYVGVEGDQLSFTKQTGSERPGGYIWTDTDKRMIFLGAMALGTEAASPAYGDRAERNLIGIVERVAPMRYRMVLPWPQNGARLDVIELVPFVPTPA